MVKPIKRFPFYTISEKGNIFSASRLGTRGGKLNPQKDKGGYLYVRLYNGIGTWSNRPIHQLVLETFIGPCPKGMVCRHLDGNPQNNSLDNLRWGTLSENNLDTVRHGNHGGGNHKLSRKIVSTIRELHRRATPVTQARLAEYFGVKQPAISNIIRRLSWT